jgi:hypothetical protein
MNSVGIDLHRKRSFIAVIDDQGELALSRRIVNDRDTFLELLGGLEGESQIAVEATYGWEWLAELLEDAGYDMHLAHPLCTRAIAAARVKTDAVDAKTLAHLLRADLSPEAYIAPRELRDIRELLRHRAALVAMRTALKNRVHAILAKHGITHEQSDLFGKARRGFLATVALRDASRRRLDSLLASTTSTARSPRPQARSTSSPARSHTLTADSPSKPPQPGDQAADDNPRRRRHDRRDPDRRDRGRSPLPDRQTARRLPRDRPARPAIRPDPHSTRPDLQTRLLGLPARAR